MGKRGPAPKPTALRILHGDREDRINRQEPTPRPGTPQCPPWLDADARRVWDYTLAELEGMGLATPADRDALAAYCVFVVQFERATKLVDTAGSIIRGRGGSAVSNPASRVQRDAAQMMSRYAAEFGLTPRARAEIKLPPAASEDDLSRLLS
jgi:P27 family predicted phage terminase small subunit